MNSKTAVAFNHFARVDPILYQVIVAEKLSFELPAPLTDSSLYFSHLCREIIGQQLAGRAADAINKRFRELLPGKKIIPKAILKLPNQSLRDAGLSWAKVKYVKDLAERTNKNMIAFEKFTKLSDEEVVKELTQVKGIGQWTAEMFLIFTLGREDVFSFGDLGLKKGFQGVYKVEDNNLLAEMQQQSLIWSPYRSYAALALWQYKDRR
ncbi:MAG: DNA-3-methyladenine glycosylase 2 family protein [Candidatus Pacebacteria bacterium CG_4_10_14_0_8_um_filter_43_12]|nr:MAG: DNA-3-methyladenine glycosylase 2 family protein [Candidatus Pacebacteria bacterium CG10_big_fil_rev_8_21_14_0_10_44_11]PIY79029.1 MAG: DNA-3-methyladenine glycosylase 2 family protein [Candidatus Pacebacteria bacterium CG_4_10_14_0_8_um_filter_43_12]